MGFQVGKGGPDKESRTVYLVELDTQQGTVAAGDISEFDGDCNEIEVAYPRTW